MTSNKAESMGLRFTGAQCHYSDKIARQELKNKAAEYRKAGRRAYTVDDNGSYVYIYAD